MSRFGYALALGLAFATAYAASQENPNPTQQGTPATTVQQQPHPAQPPTKDAAPPETPSMATTPQTPAPPTPAPTPATTGTAQKESAANQQAATAKGTKASTANAGGMFSNPQDTARLQEQIQNAIRNEPTLSGDSLTVSVTDSEIDIGGNVSTSKDRLTARRIAQSFAGNRRVREHISVAGAATAASTTESTEKNTVPKNDTRKANKPVADPDQKGDASEKPR